MLGLVARADQRGIGILTAEFYKAMKPDKVLVVSHGQWPQNFAQYDKGWGSVVDLNLSDLSLSEHTCRKFLEGLSTVYCVETLYDWRFKGWAEEAGCKVVIHGMPELYATRDHKDGRPQPDAWLWPTPWLLDDEMTDLPEGEILPVPTVDRVHTAANPDDPILRVVHVGGTRAVGDRNGTGELLEALRYIRNPVRVTIFTQEMALPVAMSGYPNNVTVTVHVNGVADRFTMYAGHHALVLPRRYGGLCLPALEAMACGLTVILPDASPNEIWPGERIPANGFTGQLVPYGYVPSANLSPRAIAKTIDVLAADRKLLGRDMHDSTMWAVANGWHRWKPEYERVLS
jgi:glycosyltransferase involved in cell wall biosynthesis